MHPLDKTLRNKLEKTVKDARDVSEAAAKAALEQFGIGEAVAFSHLSDDERELRRKLRAHGRQLGDLRNSNTGTQQIERLVEEIAYEHWHRMLFARFLAENDLLMYPDPVEPVAVTLQECEDLAADEGAANGWELASRFAARMLPQIFRPDSPVLQIELPPEHQQKLERLVAELPLDVFTASDSLGWVYQFWQAKKKDEVNASEVKIGARELPAVTQLFTEPYMVAFLLDNSLGAWWAARCDAGKGRRGAEGIFERAESEEEIRAACAIPGVSLEYLRFVQTETNEGETSPDLPDSNSPPPKWTPAAGTFDGWSEHLSELKTLDPCCGSGHFLVAAFLMLVPMRMELEGLTASEAVDAVLKDNLHGLEIDQRCVELAAFALALTAWRYPNAGGYRKLPELNVACSGLAISAKKEEWLALAGDDTNLRTALEEIYKQFKDAPVLGSLINPQSSLGTDSLFELKWEEVGPLLTRALSDENDEEKAEMGVVARGIAKAADLLVGKYCLVITNVPYLARSKQSDTLRNYLEKHYNAARMDLATSFLSRCYEMSKTDATISVVLPQNWLYQSSYKSLRQDILKDKELNALVRLGEGGFESMAAAGAFVALFITSNSKPSSKASFAGINVAEVSGASNKSEAVKITEELISTSQSKQLENPDFIISLSEIDTNKKTIGDFFNCYQGLRTGDSVRFIRNVWEREFSGTEWELFQTTGDDTGNIFSGFTSIIYWQGGKGELHEYARKTRNRLHDMHESGNLSWSKHGIAISQMRNLRTWYYTGSKYDNSLAVATPIEENDGFAAAYSYMSSGEYQSDVRNLNQSLYVTNSTLVKVPFDLEYWTKVAEEKYPNGLPKPYSDDPTQWIFHGHPAHSDEPLQVAVARLLGYRFPAELDAEMELSDEARFLCDKSKELLPFADEDGIVCIPSVRGELSAADRLLNLLAAAYGDDWSNEKLAQLLKDADHAGKTLDTWLREKFFTQHFKLFGHRPFIWHIWDGLRDGFAALVNYHKLDYKNLETLIYTYLGDWITRQKQEIAAGIDGSQERLAAAEQLKKKLELILEGEEPYDIFVRWKPLEEQPSGWNPDLNDGVRMNIRPFMTVEDVNKKGAGVLRDKPNIHWKKDRGKDVESAPWYKLGLEYDGKEGDRINDHHLSLDEKKEAKSIN